MSQWGEPRNFRAGSVTFRFVPHIGGAPFQGVPQHDVIDSVMCENRSDGKRTLDDDMYLAVLPYAEALVGCAYSEWLKIPKGDPSPNNQANRTNPRSG